MEEKWISGASPGGNTPVICSILQPCMFITAALHVQYSSHACSIL
jgi:hypothetical protein